MSEEQARSKDRPTIHAACDSQVLLWSMPWAMTAAAKKKRKEGQDVIEMRRRARLLMTMLDNDRTIIVIPSVAVAELLAGIDPARHVSILAEFTNRFFCPPFDAAASILAAKLWQYERGLKNVSPGLPEDDRSERIILKADMLIISTAKMAGATIFFSHDEKARRLAKQADMEARDLPVSSGDWIKDYDVAQAVKEDE